MHKLTRVIPVLALALMLSVGSAEAQTTTTTPFTTPAAPNAGAGGDMAQNLLALAVTAGIVVAGLTYLVRTRHG